MLGTGWVDQNWYVFLAASSSFLAGPAAWRLSSSMAFFSFSCCSADRGAWPSAPASPPPPPFFPFPFLFFLAPPGWAGAGVLPSVASPFTVSPFFCGSASLLSDILHVYLS